MALNRGVRQRALVLLTPEQYGWAKMQWALSRPAKIIAAKLGLSVMQFCHLADRRRFDFPRRKRPKESCSK